ncbi:MAG TPA: valine--tRNA ligase [Gemmatimonadaceae bacterium]|nr:valine--tRNA ligase [Gemmatimonadaceae bacterium]
MTRPRPDDDEPREIPARYDAGATERALYEEWEAAGVFRADAARSKRSGGDREPFAIVMPPPNVTAALHVGHALNNIVQDVLARWRRMAGDETLWLPGTDHAGIATQNVVEKLLASEGTSREALGRDAFVARVRSFVEETGGAILHQLRTIGASADWTRTAYTFSPALSRAVRDVFVRLFDDGLIYRGHRVIHWCPRCLTALSDEEAEFTDAAGTLFHIRYPLADDPSAGLVVATTRPETMLGDVAVAVHPDDARYRAFVGRRVRLPIAGVEIPVIADDAVDHAFGTGAVKITPAHDANDFEVGRRHRLPMPVVMAPDGTMAEDADAEGRVPAPLRGLDRVAARARIVAQLEAERLLVRTEPHAHAVRRCYRCETVVEPRLSDQWFVKMAPLAKPALDAVRDGRVRILPERWHAVYVNWMENIRDWNISRQIWWGHRVPVWYCDECDPPQNVIASREDLAQCPHCGCPVRQDEDVLDTWFSSWLWPFSTLGWPEQDTADQRAFYPTDVLVTAPEILFFWVARMIMSGFYCMGREPFHTVYLHGTVRDLQHRKMSKSLGNGIDPLDVVQRYGADALRYTQMAGTGLGVDVMLDPDDLEKSFAPGRNFATKLWNIGRFLLLSVGAPPVRRLEVVPANALTRADRWILGRLAGAIAECDAALGPARPASGGWPGAERNAGMRFDAHVEAARRFVWNELADWYVEATKARLQTAGEDREVARAVLVHVFDHALRLLHPVMPFITEALWRRLPGHAAGTFLATAEWPRAAAVPEGAGEFDVVREAIGAIRQLRSDYAIPPAQTLAAHVVGPPSAARRALLDERPLAARLARCDLLETAPGAGAAAHAVLASGVELVLPLTGIVDIEKECARLTNELAGLDRQLSALRGRLANEKFTSRAPKDVVEAERAKEREWGARRDQLSAKVRTLCGA